MEHKNRLKIFSFILGVGAWLSLVGTSLAGGLPDQLWKVNPKLQWFLSPKPVKVTSEYIDSFVTKKEGTDLLLGLEAVGGPQKGLYVARVDGDTGDLICMSSKYSSVDFFYLAQIGDVTDDGIQEIFILMKGLAKKGFESYFATIDGSSCQELNSTYISYKDTKIPARNDFMHLDINGDGKREFVYTDTDGSIVALKF